MNHNRDTKHMHKDGRQKRIPLELVGTMLEAGWKFGRPDMPCNAPLPVAKPNAKGVRITIDIKPLEE